MTPTFTLTAPGVEPLNLGGPDNPIGVRAHTIGPPTLRVVSEPVPDGDGMIDTTNKVADLPISIELIVHPYDNWQLNQRLRLFASPKLRPTLTIVEPGAPDRQAIVRGVPWADSADVNKVVAEFRHVLTQWVAPSGILESVDQVTTVIFPGAAEGSGGMELPTELPVEFVSAGPPGSGTVTNAGTFDALPILRVVGPCKGPIVENRTVGRSLVFDPDFEIVAGDYLEIDCRAKTVRLNGLANQSRYDELDFAASAWWSLVPGVNDIRFTPVEFSSPCQLVVLSRSAWI